MLTFGARLLLGVPCPDLTRRASACDKSAAEFCQLLRSMPKQGSLQLHQLLRVAIRRFWPPYIRYCVQHTCFAPGEMAPFMPDGAKDDIADWPEDLRCLGTERQNHWVSHNALGVRDPAPTMTAYQCQEAISISATHPEHLLQSGRF